MTSGIQNGNPSRTLAGLAFDYLLNVSQTYPFLHK